MMGLEQILVIAMFASFMGLLLLGFPVAWSLAGVGLIFAVVGHVLVNHFDAELWFTWSGTIGVLDARIYGIVANELMVALPLAACTSIDDLSPSADGGASVTVASVDRRTARPSGNAME